MTRQRERPTDQDAVTTAEIEPATAVVVDPGGAGGAKERLGLLLLLSCVIIWGVNAVAFKVGTRPPQGQGFDAALLNGLRFISVAPLLVLIVGLRQPVALRVGSSRDLGRYALFGLVSIVGSETLLTIAVQYTSVANMTLLGPGTISLFTALWAVLLGEQAFTRTGWLGAAVAFVGVALVAGAGGGLHLDAASWRGDALALGRSVMHALYLLYLGRTLRERPVLTVTVYNVVFGALWFLPYVVWRALYFNWGAVPWQAWAALAWTVLPTTVYGFLAWNWAMRQVGAVAATNMLYLSPVCGALAAWVLLKEPLRLSQVLGGLVIVGGIVILRWDTLGIAGFVWRRPRLRLPWRH